MKGFCFHYLTVSVDVLGGEVDQSSVRIMRIKALRASAWEASIRTSF